MSVTDDNLIEISNIGHGLILDFLKRYNNNNSILKNEEDKNKQVCVTSDDRIDNISFITQTVISIELEKHKKTKKTLLIITYDHLNMKNDILMEDRFKTRTMFIPYNNHNNALYIFDVLKTMFNIKTKKEKESK